MALTVKTFGSMNEAAAALASDRTARFMRAISVGDTWTGTLVRSTDSGYREIRSDPSRIVVNFGNGVFQGGFDALKRQFGG